MYKTFGFITMYLLTVTYQQELFTSQVDLGEKKITIISKLDESVRKDFECKGYNYVQKQFYVLQKGDKGEVPGLPALNGKLVEVMNTLRLQYDYEWSRHMDYPDHEVNSHVIDRNNDEKMVKHFIKDKLRFNCYVSDDKNVFIFQAELPKRLRVI